jgi:redox-sensitive bicupin YhaK (pirin superfamily)
MKGAGTMRNMTGIFGASRQRWVGDGFPVRQLFSYQTLGARHISPFLMLDYFGPTAFQPTAIRRGVGAHPHKGFETVTLVYEGEVEHRDSTGAGGVIGPGDVQWMTAGAGIVHQEYHSAGFAGRGGILHGVQLWVNLPAHHKSAPPGYQSIVRQQIPVVDLPDAAGTLRVIAGDFQGVRGAADTFTEMNIWDLSLNSDCVAHLEVPRDHNLILAVLQGNIVVNGGHALREAQMACFDAYGTSVTLTANEETRLLLLSGLPIDEPVEGRGPFVMNTQEDVRQAYDAYRQGLMGQLD